MADTGTTASYEANPGQDSDGVPVCRRECGAYGERQPFQPNRSALDDYYGQGLSGGTGQRPPTEPFCCITKSATYENSQCRPVLLHRLRVGPELTKATALPGADGELEETVYQAALEAQSVMRTVVSGLRARGYDARAKALDKIREQWARECRGPLADPAQQPDRRRHIMADGHLRACGSDYRGCAPECPVEIERLQELEREREARGA